MVELVHGGLKIQIAHYTCMQARPPCVAGPSRRAAPLPVVCASKQTTEESTTTDPSKIGFK